MRCLVFICALVTGLMVGCSSTSSMTTRSYTLRNASESKLIAAKLQEAWDGGDADPGLKSEVTDDGHALVTAPARVHRNIEAALKDARQKEAASRQ